MQEPKLQEKRWTKEVEKEVYSEWKKNQVYKFNKNTKKKVFSIDTPPPYVNTPVHIGQVTTYVLMDCFARYKRMKGFEVLFPLGLDRNGLPIEIAAEKKFKISPGKVSREEYIEKCRKILEESSLASVESFLRCGISFNSWEIGKGIGDIYETDSPDYRSLTQDTFIELWNKGLIYEASRINNYCPGCRTTLADAEVTYEDIPTNFNDILFKIKETGEEIIIGTTRPELISTCAAVIFNPKDDRYKKLEGKTAITPIYEKEVPIMAHPYAQLDKGTGLVMMCSAGDLSDIRFFREQNFTPVIAIGQDGKMNEHAGFIKGLKVKEAREKIIEELKKKELIVNQVKINHRTPICERSKHEIEFIEMSEFYVKQVDFKDDLANLANKLNFYDEKSREILLSWINSVSIDWPISRRRYYATEVPIWYCKNCKETFLPKKGTYHQPWKDPAPVKQCTKCKSKEFIGETRVFDTWFDSSNSPLYILKWSRDDSFFKKNSPATLRPQGKEIVRTWLYYTLLKAYHLTGKLIFKDAWINYHIVDENGKKMSKSIGNVVDPKEVLDKFGAEPFRLWSAVEGDLSKNDNRCSFERIEGSGKTITKLWNVARFISMFPEKKAKKLMDLDKWILDELNDLVNFADTHYEGYDFHNPATKIKHFIWETLASHYIELVKPRAYNEGNKFTEVEQASALHTIHTCLDILLKILAPINPLVTYKIYKELRKKDIHFESFPKSTKKEKLEFKTAELEELNREIWKVKKDNSLSLKDSIKQITLDKKFKSIEKDLQAAHNIQSIKYGKLKIEL
ncbi:MAG: valine--tRNA ligase [Candidatus Nanoarchaeia archaeon]|nr:valine--tRNA ligase [Candidatus Nanoarchaeia archaeon]